MEGLVVGSLWKAKERYKGGTPNEEDGSKVECLLREIDGEGEISVNREVADSLNAGVGDIVYLSDARWWLGGLRSVHAKLSKIRDDDDSTVFLPRSLVLEGSLQVGRKHKIERIM